MFVLTFAMLLVGAQAKISDCGSKLATVHNVEVNGCAADATECILRRNTNATITIDFTPNVEVANVMTVVHGVLKDVSVPFPFPQPDSCKDVLTCPLKAGEKVTYKASLPVRNSYPKVNVDVKWELKTVDFDLVCILIPSVIV